MTVFKKIVIIDSSSGSKPKNRPSGIPPLSSVIGDSVTKDTSTILSIIK